MEIRSLEHIGFDTLFRGFENAFSDYEISFDKEEVRSMLIRRGYESSLSFAAFDDAIAHYSDANDTIHLLEMYQLAYIKMLR